MLSYTLRRLLTAFFVLAFSSFAIFAAVNWLPGDAAAIELGTEVRADTLAARRAELGLDQPLWQRYAGWISGVVQGDFGTSFRYGQPVRKMIADRLWVSLPLAGLALALAVITGIPLGLWAAFRHRKLSDTIIVGLSQTGVAIPNFWLGILLIFVFAVQLRWLPSGGFSGWDDGLYEGLRRLILPAIALALPQAAILVRVMRSSLLEVAHADFMRTARAKGRTRFGTVLRHGLRNAIIPVLTIMGLQFSFLIAGAIVIEQVFSLPGLGRLIVQAIEGRDLITLQSTVLLLVVALVLVNWIVDVLYVWADPRLRGGGRLND